MQHGVTVRIGFRGYPFGDRPARPATIFYDELLTEHFTELAENDARRGIGAAGRRIGHDHAHRAVRPGSLRAGRAHEWSRGHPRQDRASRKCCC